MSPSSAPAQNRIMLSCEGPPAYMTPRRVGFAVSALRYLPIVACGSQIVRVRSGLIFCQLLPPVAVFQSVFDAKYITCGSTVEKTTGAVRSVRKSEGRTGVGAMF